MGIKRTTGNHGSQPSTASSHVPKCACRKGKHVDSSTLGQAIIMGMVFIPVYVLVLFGCWLGWF